MPRIRHIAAPPVLRTERVQAIAQLRRSMRNGLLSVGIACLMLAIPIALLAISSIRPETATESSALAEEPGVAKIAHRIEELNRKMKELAQVVQELKQESPSDPRSAKSIPQREFVVESDEAGSKQEREPDVVSRIVPNERPEAAQDEKLSKEVAAVRGMLEVFANRMNQLLVDANSASESSSKLASVANVEQPTEVEVEKPVQARNSASTTMSQRPPANDSSASQAVSKTIERPVSERSSRRRRPAPDPKRQPRNVDESQLHALPGARPVGGDVVKTDSFSLNILRPRVGSLVDRTVDLIAATTEPGWPVFMVRSEIDGDYWWVQRVVARRGQHIAARLNFGNEETLSGDYFQAICLLVDSQAETVRFRTARQFKDIPEGVRRSRIFRYVRR